MKKRILPVVIFFLSGLFLFAQDQNEKLSLEHYADYEWVSNPEMSPDGKQVLYTRNWINLVDDKRENDIWIINADGTKNRFFVNGSNGKWSPDGSRIAFTRKGEPNGTQIFIKYVDEPGEATQITRLENSPSGISWSPDGKYLAFSMLVDGKTDFKIDIPSKPEKASWTKAPKVIDKPTYRRDRVGFLEPGYSHIFIVSSEGGTERQLTSGDWHHRGNLSWSPDGENILFSSLREPEAEYAYRQSNIYTVSVKTKEINQISTREGREGSASYSPDGSKIAFTGSIWTENFYHDQKMFVMNSDGTGLKNLTADFDRVPGSPMWAKDNSGVYFNVREEGESNLYFVDLQGELRKITSGAHMLTSDPVNSEGMSAAIFSSPTNPPDLAMINANTGEVNQLTRLNEDILDFVDLGEVEEVNYKSADGTDIQGWLVKPPDFDAKKKYPLILRIHGGPHSMYHTGFNFNFQLHAADGYLVLYTNPRGSTGYGYDFANAIQNSYPGKDYEDLMAGVDKIIERGYVDEERLIVYGGSGGGVLTSWIIGQTDRFAAASVNYPVINWMSFVGTTDGIGWYRNFEKYPWEDPSEHIKRSPLMYVGNVKTPTMLMCGENDLRTPISQTEEYFAALQVNKVPSVMIRFNDEFHGTSSKPSNFLRTMGYLNSWFEKHAPEKQEEMIKP